MIRIISVVLLMVARDYHRYLEPSIRIVSYSVAAALVAALSFKDSRDAHEGTPLPQLTKVIDLKQFKR